MRMTNGTSCSTRRKKLATFESLLSVAIPPKQVRKALEQLKKQNMRGLIVDLRYNPGGLLSSAIEICDMFVEKGRIVSTKGRNVKERKWDAHKKDTFSGFPMVVMVNQYSASASEILSACLQDHKRAIVVGERTFGKGSVQNIIQLEGGKSALKLTTASYWRPNGKNIHRFPKSKDSDDWGVTPNKELQCQTENQRNPSVDSSTSLKRYRPAAR